MTKISTPKNQKLTTNDVKHVAKLAQLSLTDKEISKFQIQLSNILEYVNQLQKIDTKGIKETSQVTGLTNIFRKDKIGKCLSQKQALSNTQQTHKGYFKVPGILNEA